MAKLPGLVNYSDDEDQSSSSSAEDDVQQKEEQPPSTEQPPSQQQPTLRTPSPQPVETNSNKSIHVDNNRLKKQEPSPLSNKSTLQPQEINTASPLSTTAPADRSTRLKTILTPKPIPSVDNWGIPPEPQIECDPDRLEKIQHFLSLRRSGHRLNDHLQRNKSFRNPRIYAKLVEFVDLDETGSNFPTDQFDPTSFPASSYIDGILETQRQLAEEKAQLQAQGRSHIAFTPPANKPPPPPMDASAKFAAAMANAAKIANKIAKPTHAPLAASQTAHQDYDNDNNSKRSSHRKWDRQDDRKRPHVN
ncbi:HCNGP-like protein-domain-containing protein [Chlamydoabsidia padenii]|nr:HCNGP-like protein-domain-containing protein [Chlamydoabsidia padenii]